MLEVAGAVPAGWPDEGVAAHYGDPVREQRAMEGAGAVIDRSNRGVVTVAGPDRLSWLHSLTSQHLEQLAPGRSAQALILSPQGHIEHHLALTDDGERVWAHVEPETAPALVAYLESMRFLLRVEVADVTARYGVLSVAGEAAGAAAAVVGSHGAAAAISDPLGTALIVERAAAGQVLAALEAPAAGLWAYEALRIAAHVPRAGIDTDQRTLPHEAGLIEAAVHLNKGCYRGQETVARVHNLGHPPRRLVMLHLDGSADRLPAHGAPLLLPDGSQVGSAGSAARHHELGPIGLGLVKRTVPPEATLSADGIAAAQEVIVPPDAGANVTVTLRRDAVPQPPASARRLK